MSYLFEIADQIENEPTAASTTEMVEYAYANPEDAPATMRSLAEELRHIERSASDIKLGSAGAVKAARTRHARLLEDVAVLNTGHAETLDEVAKDPDLSEAGKQKRREIIATQHARERTEMITLGTGRIEELLNAREIRLREQLVSAPKPITTDPVAFALNEIKVLERARLYLDQMRRLKPADFNSAALAILERDPLAAPHVVRAADVFLVNDEAHGTALAGFVTATVDQRRGARLRKAFSDPSSPRARAASELALIRRTREVTKVHSEQMARDGSAASALAANFKPEQF